jgi:hypothetical protein
MAELYRRNNVFSNANYIDDSIVMNSSHRVSYMKRDYMSNSRVNIKVVLNIKQTKTKAN